MIFSIKTASISLLKTRYMLTIKKTNLSDIHNMEKNNRSINYFISLYTDICLMKRKVAIMIKNRSH